MMSTNIGLIGELDERHSVQNTPADHVAHPQRVATSSNIAAASWVPETR